jgi:hypothetical protein
MITQDKIEELERRIAELKTELDRVQCDECMDLQDENIILKKSNEELVELCSDLITKVDNLLNESFEENDMGKLKLILKIEVLEKKLASIKYLDKKEVEKVFANLNPDYKKYIIYNEAITTICKLAIPEIDRKKISKLLFDSFIDWNMPYKPTEYLSYEELREWYKNYMELLTNEIIKSIRGK